MSRFLPRLPALSLLLLAALALGAEALPGEAAAACGAPCSRAALRPSQRRSGARAASAEARLSVRGRGCVGSAGELAAVLEPLTAGEPLPVPPSARLPGDPPRAARTRGPPAASRLTA